MLRASEDEFSAICFRQAGILTTAQAVCAAGRGIVRGHVAAGRWRRVCRGILATTNGQLDRRQQLWVAILTAGDGAALAGMTALVEAGLRGLREPGIRILVPADRNGSVRLSTLPRDMPAVRISRTRLFPDEHRQAGSPPRVITARAVVDAAVWAPTEDAARSVIAASCQQRRVTPGEVFEVLSTFRRLPRLALITATLRDVEGGAQALSEIDFVTLCRRFGLPPPNRQERRQDGAGRTRFLDAYWKRWRLHVEIDGSHHMDVKQWERDMLRQNRVWIGGDRILRFPAGLIRSRPDEVVGQLRLALEAAGWRR
jgi:hypothetical protein